ncbi:MAG: molybdenum cofactor biosynthesis protein MoaB [Thermoprotei archaeon]|nr:MAG: molybdenum cofactor biosynthesis protein MoaB [Thermoprotei archaeon]
MKYLLPIWEHRAEASKIKVRFCLVVTSDSVVRGERRDEVTPLSRELILSKGHELVHATVVPNDESKIREIVSSLLDKCDVVLVTGGTGLSSRDVSVDAIKPLCTKEIPGYGELFRYLTFRRYGAAALATRAMACLSGKTLIFATPGSKDAVELALNELILPEISHLVYEVRK